MTIAIVNHGLGVPTYQQLVEAERAANRARLNEASKLSGKPGDHLFYDAAVEIHERAAARLQARIDALLAFDISTEQLELIRHHHDPDEQTWFEALDDTWRTTVHRYDAPMTDAELFHLFDGIEDREAKQEWEDKMVDAVEIDLTDSDPRLDITNAEAMHSDAQHEWEQSQWEWEQSR